MFDLTSQIFYLWTKAILENLEYLAITQINFCKNEFMELVDLRETLESTFR